MNKMRILYGLHWPSWHPPINTILNWAIGGMAFVLLTIIQGWMNERDQAINATHQAKREVNHYRDLFDRCLNGGVVGRSGGTVLACKGAEEINLGNIQLINPVKTQ